MTTAPRYPNDYPPNSRLFIISGKGITEEEYDKCFSKFGSIQDIWIIRDRQTNDEKGIVYIKFNKTSAAFLAMEEMNGRCMPGHPKLLKVLVANSKRDGSVRDPREDERLVRLFVIVPKTYSEEDVRTEFEKFGDIESVTILTDRKTGESKGFGYVKYHRPYHAALAYESCDPVFKPKFAEPKVPRHEREYDHNGGGGGGDYYDYMDRGVKRGFNEMGGRDDYSYRGHDMFGGGGAGYSQGLSDTVPPYQASSTLGPFDPIQNYPHNNCQRLHLTVAPGLSQSYLTRLLSLVPGLEYCDLYESAGIAYARYCTPQAAAYARDKLEGFEYPIGSRIHVRYADQPANADPNATYSESYTEGSGSGSPHWTSTPKDTYKKAAMVLEKAGINPECILAKEPVLERVRYSNISLPRTQSLRSEDTPVSQRLFIVCQPSAVPEMILRDCFCRFGDLIDVYLLLGRNYGYAKFACKEAANRAMHTLHGQSIAGQRLKVLAAEPPRSAPSTEDDGPSKKQRL
ncbi:RNA-binding protein 45-like [Argonauta hians]